MQEDHNYKKTFAKWFQELDLRQVADFKDADDALELEKRMEANLRDYVVQPQVRASGIRKLTIWTRSVAAAMLLTGLAALSFFLNQKTNQPQKDRFYELSTLAGEKKIITLADGTKIHLNNTSRISYAKNYTGKHRMVFLDGEAYFDVVHNKEQPFIVTSGKLKVHVLGTSFNVSAYPFESEIAVTVASGRVGVVEDGKPKAWMLRPGAQLNYLKQSGEIQLKEVSAGDYSGWMTGSIAFNNERMDVICERLSRSYGVQFRIQSQEIKGKRINLKINNENISTIVKMLALTGQFNYKIEGKEIRIW